MFSIKLYYNLLAKSINRKWIENYNSEAQFKNEAVTIKTMLFSSSHTAFNKDLE